MTHDADDELDRLRLALLHERSRADRAEQELAELKAAAPPEPPVATAAPAPAATPARRPWRRR
jgi:hypothetical protein